MSTALKISFNPGLPGMAWHTKWSEKRNAWMKSGKSFPGQWYVFSRTRAYPATCDQNDYQQRQRMGIETVSAPLFAADTAEACHEFIRQNEHLRSR